MRLVNPLEAFGSKLNSVSSPSRYLGMEYGITVKPHTQKKLFNFAMAFPDLYEIGMSNLAVKIIYNGLNAYEGIRCERVFAPDVDFEKLLANSNVPLYTLETGMPLCCVDMIGFSIGYELGITEVLAMLQSGKVPLCACDRKEGDPIVIAGGCGVTNPAPFAKFFDAVIIGEAEAGMFPMVDTLAQKKAEGASREELISYMETLPFMWTRRTAESGKVARRAVQGNFGLVPSVPSWFPLPSLKPVQDHGVIEIMRGCPNGCRFCHAGVYYRPNRVKALSLIIEEIDHLVFDAGYREISLNSLSSADFPDIEGLLDILNKRYEGYNVSFQLPSLKVNSLSLPILEKLSKIRRSGLTFAVETPEELWQLSLNKEVYAQHLTDIILEAKKRGWSGAKFYFMVGLPVGDYFKDGSKTEEEAITDFLLEIQAKTRIQCNVNVGVFIPKPHTPYQWVRQITPQEASKKLDYIASRLPRGKFKLSRFSFDITILEGLFSRGDFYAGDIILDAFLHGARFDAWDEHLRLNMPLWNDAFDRSGHDVLSDIFKEWDTDSVLPWDSVSLGPSRQFFKREWSRSLSHTLSPRCETSCSHRCGVCNDDSSRSKGDTSVSVHKTDVLESVSNCLQNKTVKPALSRPDCNIPILYRVIFSFKRSMGTEYTAYLSQVETFHKAFLRSGLPVVFTAGFNPLPRLEFATAMTLGLVSEEEIASCLLYDNMTPEEFMASMNAVLPAGFALSKAFIFACTNEKKREALSSVLWGADFNFTFNKLELSKKADISVLEVVRRFALDEGLSESEDGDVFLVKGNLKSGKDKALRKCIEEASGVKWYEFCTVYKNQTLSWSEELGRPVSFFELYEKIARENAEIIERRKVFDLKKAEFYAQHPDVLERHLKNKERKKNQTFE